MTWTYTALPRTDIDRIRLLIGDTIPTDQQVQDEEIATFLLLEGNPDPMHTASSHAVLYRAAAATAGAIGAHYARVYTNTVGPTKTQGEVLQKHYMDRAAVLLLRAGKVGIGPRAGGLSISQKQVSQQQTDLPQPYFTRDQFTEPGTGPDSPILGNSLLDPTA